MTFSGDFSTVGTASIFQFFNFCNLTGVVKFITLDNLATIYFEHGKLISARLQDNSMRLGDYLVTQQLITPEQRDGALHAYRHEKGLDRIGHILVSRGYLTQDQLEQAIQDQMADVVYQVVKWKKGFFVFFPGAKPSKDDIVFKVTLDFLLLEGLRRSDEQNKSDERPLSPPKPIKPIIVK